MTAHHLAQLNVARARGPLDGPVMAEFMAALGPINGLGDASPGFVWRLQTDDGDATSLRPFDDDRMIVNLARLHHLRAHGPTADAFTFRTRMPAPALETSP